VLFTELHHSPQQEHHFMVKYRKLSTEEVSSMRTPPTGQRKRIREEYQNYLDDLQVDEGGELILDDERKSTVKNRLKRAAEDLNMEIKFKRSASDVVRFIVMAREE
jgi:hypothetical protein